jgi:hypothetical protein
MCSSGGQTVSFDVSFFQIIASLALTLASFTVAAVSLYFTYRHNRGWKPIILVIAQARVAHGRDMPPNEIWLVFEVWNRKKYPIVIDQVTVTFSKLDFIDPPHHDEIESESDKGKIQWFREGKEFESYHQTSLDQNAKHTFHLAAPYKPDGKGDEDKARISVRYFDPIRNKYRKVKSQKIVV